MGTKMRRSFLILLGLVGHLFSPQAAQSSDGSGIMENSSSASPVATVATVPPVTDTVSAASPPVAIVATVPPVTDTVSAASPTVATVATVPPVTDTVSAASPPVATVATVTSATDSSSAASLIADGSGEIGSVSLIDGGSGGSGSVSLTDDGSGGSGSVSPTARTSKKSRSKSKASTLNPESSCGLKLDSESENSVMDGSGTSESGSSIDSESSDPTSDNYSGSSSRNISESSSSSGSGAGSYPRSESVTSDSSPDSYSGSYSQSVSESSNTSSGNDSGSRHAIGSETSNSNSTSDSHSSDGSGSGMQGSGTDDDCSSQLSLPEKYQKPEKARQVYSYFEVKLEATATGTCPVSPNYLWYWEELSNTTTSDSAPPVKEYSILNKAFYENGNSSAITIPKNEFNQSSGKLVVVDMNTCKADFMFIDFTNKDCMVIAFPEEFKTPETAEKTGMTMKVKVKANVSNKNCPFTPTYLWYWVKVGADESFGLSNPVNKMEALDPATYGKSWSITLPPEILEPGIRMIKVVVNETGYSDIVFLDFIRSDLVALIAGGTLRTVSSGDTVEIDGESLSSDPDLTSDPLLFSWSCEMGSEIATISEPSSHFTAAECSPLLSSVYRTTGSKFTIDTMGLSIGRYIIRLKVAKDTRTAFYDQTINVVKGYVPKMEIKCLVNCQARVVPSNKLSLTLNCTGCDYEQLGLQFKWSLDMQEEADYKPVDLETLARTGISSEGFVIGQDKLQRATRYRARLMVTCPVCADSVLEYSFLTNSPPTGGNCSVSPASGEALITMFQLMCDGWSSPSGSPLFYRFETQVEDQMQLLYSGSESQAPPSPLSLGDQTSDYNRVLVMGVLDVYGSKTTEQITVQVTSIQPSENSTASSMMTSALNNVDLENVEEAAQIIQSIGSILNTKDPSGNSTMPTEEATQMRKNMVGQISKMASGVSSLNDIMLFSEAIGTSTEVRDEVDSDTLDQATDVMTGMLDAAVTLLEASPESAQRVAQSVMFASWNVLYSAKPKTAEVDTTPELLTPEMEAAQEAAAETADLSPEEQAFYDKQQQEKLRIQREAEAKRAKAATEKLAQVQATMAKALLRTLAPGEAPVSLSTGKAAMSVAKNRPSGLVNSTVESVYGTFSLPSTLKMSGSANTIVQQQVSSFKDNPYLWGTTSTDIGSAVTNASFTNETGAPLSLESPVSMAFVSQVVPPALEVDMASAANNKTKMIYHKVNVTAPNSAIVMELAPPSEEPIFDVFVRHLTAPDNTTYDYKTRINATEATNASEVPVFIPGSVVTNIGIYYIGLRPVTLPGGSRKKRSVAAGSGSYSVKIATTGCRAWDNNLNDWVSTGELVSTGTSVGKTTCLATPVAESSAFGCAFIAPPNMIDFSTVFLKFANLKDNAAVFSVVIVVICLYLLLLVWAVRADKKDVEKWQIQAVDDNHPDDHVIYLVTVETGLKRAAGTSSTVWFTIFGRWADTGMRSLASSAKKGFPSGSTLTFVVRTPVHLGRIGSLRLWHDDSGKGSGRSWYVRKVTVEDKEMQITSVFQCNSWLAKDSEDGRTSRTFKVSSREERTRFSNMYKDSVHNQVTDSHLWVSVFLRPKRSNFTRAQRLTSAVSILFLSMITSAMFYKSEDNVEKPAQIKMGPFSFSVQELFVSVITVLICLPPSLIMVTIFRQVNKRKAENEDADLNTLLEDRSSTNIVAQHDMTESLNCTSPHLITNDVVADLMKYESKFTSKQLQMNARNATRRELISKDLKLKDAVLLHFGWILAEFSIFVSGFFVILYSMEWGPQKANAWLTAYLMSFLETTFVSDPIKVTVVALLIAFVMFRDKDKIKDYEDDGKGSFEEADDMTPEQIAAAKKRAQMEIRASAALKELIGHLVFMLLILMVTYGSTDSQSHNVYKTMHDTFIDSFKEGVGSFEDFFTWMDEEFVPNYFVLEDVNGNTLHWRERKFTVDRASFRVGPARLRQLRASTSRCLYPILNQTCYGGYSMYTEDTSPFGPEAIRNDTRGVTYHTATSWLYTPASSIRGEPYIAYSETYSGGGYLAKLDLNRNISIEILNELKSNLWLDRQTRVVFIEFSVYNPNIQVFTFVTIGIEVPPSGGVLQYATVQVLRAYPIGVFSILNYIFIFCIGVYFIVLLVIDIIGLVKKRARFFHSAKNWLNLITLILIIIMITTFALRMSLMTSVLAEMKQDLNEYVPLRRVTLYDEIFKATLALLCTLALMKFMLLLQISKRIGELFGTLRSAMEPLTSLFVASFIMLVAFTGLTHTWLRTQLEGYSTVPRTLSSLFAIMLGDFAAEDLMAVDIMFAAIVFSLFNVTMSIIMLNILCSILMDAQVSFQNNKVFHSDDHLLAQLLIEKIFSGVKKGVETTQKVKNL